MCTHTQIERKHFFLCTCNHDLESNVPQHTHTHTQGDSAWKHKACSDKHKCYIRRIFCALMAETLSMHSHFSSKASIICTAQTAFQDCSIVHGASKMSNTKCVKKSPCSLQPPLSRRFSSAGTYSALIALMVPAERPGVKCFAHRWKSPGLRLDTRILYR